MTGGKALATIPLSGGGARKLTRLAEARGGPTISFGKRPRSGLEAVLVDPVLADLVADDPLRGIQEPGRAGAVAARALEGVEDHVLLVGGDGGAEAEAREGARHLRGLEGGREVVAVDHAALADEDRALDAVLELAHVAGPVVAHQHVD